MEQNQQHRLGDRIPARKLIDGDRFHYIGKPEKVYTAVWDKRTLYRREYDGERHPAKFPANKFMQDVVWLRNIHDGKQATTAWTEHRAFATYKRQVQALCSPIPAWIQ